MRLVGFSGLTASFFPKENWGQEISLFSVTDLNSGESNFIDQNLATNRAFWWYIKMTGIISFHCIHTFWWLHWPFFLQGQCLCYKLLELTNKRRRGNYLFPCIWQRALFKFPKRRCSYSKNVTHNKEVWSDHSAKAPNYRIAKAE